MEKFLFVILSVFLKPEVFSQIDTGLLFTVAYRHQKTKSDVSQNFGQYTTWEYDESLNRLSFGIGITFR